MITDITMQGVASYKQQTTLHTNKIVNLIYGLNGSGKSTLSEFLRHKNNEVYAQCQITPSMNADEEEILVYNDKYVQDVFYEHDNLQGIFSLSKENADAQKNIDDAQKKKNTLTETAIGYEKKKTEKTNEYQKNREAFYEDIWNIKKKYAGGDRVLEYCLKGVMGSKETLAQALQNITKPQEDIPESIESLKDEITLLNNASNAQPIALLSEYEYHGLSEEDVKLLKDVITGDQNSRVANLINQLQSSDWVRQGLTFDSPNVCPFCQRPYETDSIIEDLKKYFNQDYEQAVLCIQNIYQRLQNQKESIISLEQKYDEIECIKQYKAQYVTALIQYKDVLSKNLDILAEKLHNPEKSLALLDVQDVLTELNHIVKLSNTQITNFNQKVATIREQYMAIKEKFWKKMRWQYDAIIKRYEQQEKGYQTYINTEYNPQKQNVETQLREVETIMQQEVLKIVNIEEAITHINGMLIDMGITDFHIVKSREGEELYHIVRGEEEAAIFKTLSEGEKVVISFLYFLESCLGLQNKTATPKKRIIVIDDPISSLSHIYVFNIGRLIRQTFFPETKTEDGQLVAKIKPPFEQIFVLTHSLYFFYELTDTKDDKRKLLYAYFRISKNSEGSKISDMKYSEIQNEYQAYWTIINDPKSPSALIANSMRNVIDYFFGFVENIALNNVFNKPSLQNPKFQAFNRYINRESHSDPQNIMDIKEFDYDIFQEALGLVFSETGYGEHYKKMRKISCD
mgnify:CR=1 FL=1